MPTAHLPEHLSDDLAKPAAGAELRTNTERAIKRHARLEQRRKLLREHQAVLCHASHRRERCPERLSPRCGTVASQRLRYCMPQVGLPFLVWSGSDVDRYQPHRPKFLRDCFLAQSLAAALLPFAGGGCRSVGRI